MEHGKINSTDRNLIAKKYTFAISGNTHIIYCLYTILVSGLFDILLCTINLRNNVMKACCQQDSKLNYSHIISWLDINMAPQM